MDDLELMELPTDELLEIYDIIENYLQKIDKDISTSEAGKNEKWDIKKNWNIKWNSFNNA